LRNRDGVTGPISGIAAEPMYLDVSVAPHGSFSLSIPRGHSAFAYAFEGQGTFGADDRRVIATPRLVVWDDGDSVDVRADQSAVRFLLVSGKPLGEPIARYGPFVMNTKEEIEQTLREIQQGTFAK
jgi:quercetin 2,3-dioxygenase